MSERKDTDISKRPTVARRYFDALKEIAGYQSPEWMRRHSDGEYGLNPAEAVKMAYENAINTAKQAIRGRKRPL